MLPRDVLLLLVTALVAVLPPVPLQRPYAETHLPRVMVRAVLREAHVYVFDKEPSEGRLRVAAAQVRLEGLALPGKNLGGLERIKGQPWVQVDPVTQLRAFDTYAEAARAYWTLLAKVCRGALASFDYAGPEEIAGRLYRCWWFRSPEDRYARVLRALLREP